MPKVGLIGAGAIGSYIMQNWKAAGAGFELASVLVRPRQVEAAAAMAGRDTLVTTCEDEFLRHDNHMIIEAAGHDAVLSLALPTLRAGKDLYLLSIGTLADDAFREQLMAAAGEGRSNIMLPAGALAGFDGLLALRGSGITHLEYLSIKPPYAWKGTVAEELCDLDGLAEACHFFEGSAREAAKLFPKNANLAAAVALSGRGLDATRVELTADPAVAGNVGIIRATGKLSSLEIVVSGEAAIDNPKTSAIVGASVLSALQNQRARLRFI